MAGRREVRLIMDGARRGAENMAIDEAALRMLSDSGPTLRIYAWSPPAVSIGYFQSMEEEVDVEAARSKGVDVVRRLTGGGAVYHRWEATYSIVIPPEWVPGRVLDSYKLICGGIVRALEKMGLEASFAGVNDVVVGGKKISGSAQTRRFGGVLQHGTLLIDVDVDEMFTLLKVPSEKVRDKMIKSVKDRVTSLRSQGVDAEFQEVAVALAEGFAEAMDLHLIEGELTREEMELARKLEVERYGNPEWNFKR